MYSKFAQTHCDRCGSTVGLTGLNLKWAELLDVRFKPELRPFLLCTPCKEYWESFEPKEPIPDHCQECGDRRISGYKFQDRTIWLCDECAIEHGFLDGGCF